MKKIEHYFVIKIHWNRGEVILRTVCLSQHPVALFSLFSSSNFIVPGLFIGLLYFFRFIYSFYVCATHS